MNGKNSRFKTVMTILDLLFDREEAFLTKRELALIPRNVEAGGSPDGFRYMGKIYSELSGYLLQRGVFSLLHPSLIPEMDQIQKDRQTLANDRDRVRQALTMVLQNCHGWQDIRDALPNSLASLIPECQGLERTRPEAFTIAENERSYNQYMKLREKIDFYVAARLLY